MAVALQGGEADEVTALRAQNDALRAQVATQAATLRARMGQAKEAVVARLPVPEHAAVKRGLRGTGDWLFDKGLDLCSLCIQATVLVTVVALVLSAWWLLPWLAKVAQIVARWLLRL